MHTPRTIGFIGTGIMGGPMARRLIDAGHEVRAWNRTAAKAAALGATPAETPAAAAAGAEVVIVMLSSGPVCDEVILGEQGVLDAMPPDSLLIVMSSIPVETARHQARAAGERHVHYLDAPVSGGERGAIDGTLAIMAGGDETTFARALPFLEPLGRPVRIGPAGSGQLAKLVNQLVVASTIATVSEAMLLAERGGADPARVREALLGGFADSTILRAHGQRMIEQDFAPGGPAKWQLKDTRTALSMADSLDLDLPVATLVNQLFEDMVAHGDGELDHSALILELRRRNPLPG
ncbi:NAD(P)-dependent oxidoreductase [Halomonas sp. PGE1]|uniref:NAD(P)-dependent oxidoreductase n=1 Tax=Halomonas sp. PGE1 TaxID=2730360 RepID=UPI001475AA11|nr:NAD(P)-dependent oxidoreductase [Halomonas sp. PGE1]QJQ99028.1 NAD(P)-dependent oxidoreductase [Halomonas sp. PGE1]